MPSRDEIISEIQRLAKSNGGKTVGSGRFTDETGISMYDVGRYWARWGDAVSEAGLVPNTLQGKSKDDEELVRQLADLTLNLGHFPSKAERRLKRLSDSTFPSLSATDNRLGRQRDMVRLLRDFGEANPEYVELVRILSSLPEEDGKPSADIGGTADVPGFVYLIKMEKWYKIGFTKDILRRQGEIRLVLPEKETLIHSIETDDPSGVEQYWHRRFADRKTQGEWFQLSSADVSAFRKWRRIA